MDFCKISDIEALLQITVEPAYAKRAIVEAKAAIQNYTNQTIELTIGDVVTLDGQGLGTKLFLPELPVVSVTSIVEEDETLVVVTDYKLGRYGIVHRLVVTSWYPGFSNIVVTYTHGYTTIPQEVQDVCARAASRIYQAGLKSANLEGMVGVLNYTLGDYSINWSSEATGGVGHGLAGVSSSRFLLPWEKDLLDKYRYKVL